MTGSWAPGEPIETERLVLRPHAAEDVDDLLEFHSDPDVVRYLPWPVRDREMVVDVLRTMVLRSRPGADDPVLSLAVQRAADARVIGEVLLMRTAPGDQLELGYAFGRSSWGHGYAHEACAALLAYAFDSLDVHRVFARLDARNTGSARLLERLGFRREAHFVDGAWMKDEWVTEDVYALLQSAYAAAS